MVDQAEDRVQEVTRWASLVVVLILVPAVIVLWGTPSKTAIRWAWTIHPRATPIFLGSGYAAGAFFFFRTFRARTWHPSSAGVLGASVFAGLMLIATLLHWNKFNHGHAPFLAAFAFWGWTIVYIVSPLVVFAIWWRNRATDSGATQAGDARIPDRVLIAARAFGLVALVAAAIAFISPNSAIDLWPWKLTPLTARVLASFTAQVGVGAIVLSFERRWSGWRLIVQTFIVATAFLLIGAARTWSDFDHGNAMSYLYPGCLVATDLALLALWVRCESGAKATRPG